MANTFEYRVETKTLAQLKEIAEQHCLTERHTLQLAIESLWSKTFPTLLYPKEEQRSFVEKTTGAPGPYRVDKICPSWTGLSEGVYKLVDCDILFPASWFVTEKPKNRLGNYEGLIKTVILIQILIQSSFLYLFLTCR